MLIIKRKGKKLFDQSVEKQKQEMYENIMDAYEYYYKILSK